MSRFDVEGTWEERFVSFDAAVALWEHNVATSISGARGQRVLHELEAALLALPERKLIHGTLATSEGDVCAIGALAKAKGLLPRNLPTRARVEELGPDEDWTETLAVGQKCGMTGTLAWTIGSLNDETLANTDDEGRYEAVLEWVRKHLRVVGAT